MRKSVTKIVCLFLVLTLFVLMAAASGSSEKTETKEIKDTSAAEKTEKETTVADDTKKDPETEETVEAVLDGRGIFYDKTEVWIESERLYEVLYSMEVLNG